jgi:hypothetical protein
MTGILGISLALLTLLLGGLSAWERALLRGHGSPRAMEIQGSGAGAVVLTNGERIAVRAVRGVGVTRHWVALAPVSFKGRSVLLTAGMLGAANARRLRLWALWGRMPAVASGQRLP